MLLIRQLTQLTHLDVRCTSEEYAISPFISEVAAQCPSLERFTLTSRFRKINYDQVTGLSSHTNLKVLAMDVKDLEGDPLSFVPKYQRLPSLHLTLYTINWDHFGILEKRSYKLEYLQAPQHWY